MTRNGPLALTFHAAFVTFMLAPILAVCLVAFTPEGYLALPLHGVSLRWFAAIARYPEFARAFTTSLWLGALAASVSLAIAIPAALAIARRDFPGRTAIASLLLSP